MRYRGKNMATSQWLYGNLIVDRDGNKYIIDSSRFGADGHHLVYDSTDEPVIFDQDTIGMSTGIRDANGVEVFDGDKVWGDCFAGIVRFGEYDEHGRRVGFYIEVTDKDGENGWESCDGFTVHFPIDGMEVIK